MRAAIGAEHVSQNQRVAGRLGQRTIGTTSDHLALLGCAEQFGPQRSWAILSRRLEADLLAAGESIVRVPTKLTAHARDAARSYGKSIRSTLWRSHAPRCGNPNCPLRSSTAQPAMFDCSVTTATT